MRERKRDNGWEIISESEGEKDLMWVRVCGGDRVSKRKGVSERANEKFDVVLHTTLCCYLRAMKRHYSVTCNASFR